MGGMLALEYAFLGKSYVRSIIAIATAAEQSAWCIGWSEMQRQCIFSDPKFKHGHYNPGDPPLTGLATARKAAMLTYRTRDSLQRKFNRNTVALNLGQEANLPIRQIANVDATRSTSKTPLHSRNARTMPRQQEPIPHLQTQRLVSKKDPYAKPRFAVETYLDYQGSKFVRRFDSNCYIALTQKLDSHDISRGRVNYTDDDDAKPPIEQALALIEQPVLVIGIESDVLFPISEQVRLVEGIRDAKFRTIESMEGHDAFLLATEQVGEHISGFMESTSPALMTSKSG